MQQQEESIREEYGLAGDSAPLTVDLWPGHYVLICNIVQTTNGQTVSHYQKGMVTEFTVAP